MPMQRFVGVCSRSRRRNSPRPGPKELTYREVESAKRDVRRIRALSLFRAWYADRANSVSGGRTSVPTVRRRSDRLALDTFAFASGRVRFRQGGSKKGLTVVTQ